ncbi:glycosyltransferase [Algoriphagus hitonicola]|uniref:Glycosyl transferase family 2 n=1 Tax=Algoriphagus hitonicola TaxID=435880 RepID=A0A1I2XYV6_9BACT|nr:glycosyltransferase [Algoriphagus hitonicola]SFH17251.1 Glycosyl transferase family 2 [Algoriphagus hitonicola]
MFFSVIIPVYNRPKDLKELLQSLTRQAYKNFEVIVIEDGSQHTAESVCGKFYQELQLTYKFQENQGQGFARNHGMKLATGEFFIILDSDVILPPEYLDNLNRILTKRKLDAFGGPDAASEDFSNMQKAMDFAMTSFWTTGGIRGKMKDKSNYQARGFNMGFSRHVFEKIGGFIDPNRGEDIELSMRIKKAGFKLELIPEAFVYHKRKNTWSSFARQAYSFGQNRVNVSRFHPEAIQSVHFLPTFFLAYLLLGILSLGFNLTFAWLFWLGLFVWTLLVFISASWLHRSILVGFLALICSFTQLVGYGSGLLIGLISKKRFG